MLSLETEVETFCEKYSGHQWTMVFIGFLGLLPIIMIPILIIIWLRRQTSYPLNERSPWLVFTLLVSSCVLLVAFPLNVLLYKLTDDLELCPYNSWTKSVEYKFIVIFCRYINIFTYIFRSVRMWYAFTYSRPKKYFENLFNDQRLLLLACIVSAILVCCVTTLFLEDIVVLHTLYNPPFKEGFVYRNFWTISVTVEIVGLSYILYLVRNIEREYQFRTELLLLISINWFCSVMSLVGFPGNLFDWKSPFWIAVPPQVLIMNIKDYSYVVMTAIYPLRLLRERPSLPAIPILLTMKKFTMFIKEKMCFIYFAKYAEYLSNSEEANTNPKLRYAPQFLEFFIEFMTLSMYEDTEEGRGQANERLSEYVNNHLHIFPRDLLSPTGKNNVGIAFKYCEAVLQEIFSNYYLQTRSSRQLLKMFKRNEQIGTRLADLRMISVQF